jgi:uncharacterized protein (TIGR00251 family)
MRVKVKVIPKARKIAIEPFDDGLKIHIPEPAQEGKANKKLIEMLADYYRTKKYNIKIIKGEKQREKIIAICEAS